MNVQTTSVLRLENALLLATKAHYGQLDKAGQPYILHPIAVMEMIRKEFAEHPKKIPAGVTLDDLLIAALLHDTVEDTEVTLDQIDQEFGPVVREIVDGVTRRRDSWKDHIGDENYIDFIYRAKRQPGSRIVKTADLHHNMSRIHNLPPSEQGILNRYLRAERILNDE
jgi:guanosine-3',5'-bis(diphosphate) 3'-pyrophosphohydrolase